ncbi:MAG: DUF86 domain-containing protein [Chloroflexota bacterium]|nr:DUF86 domain-containing protein [Chloroflexota bacterium]
MRDAAREAISFASGRSRGDLATSRMLVLALVKSIEIIGEAASRVSAEARAEVPAIPWQQMVAMRNRLIHAYSYNRLMNRGSAGAPYVGLTAGVRTVTDCQRLPPRRHGCQCQCGLLLLPRTV